MVDSHKKNSKYERLRRQAEELLQKSQAEMTDPDSMDIQKILHEMHVHQMELEIQNEELRRAQEHIVDLHSQYQDLYENAPCGYITINEKGIFTRCNRTGMALLGCSKKSDLKLSFNDYVSPESQDVYMYALAEAGRNKRVDNVQLKLRCLDGHQRAWVIMDIQAEYKEDQKVAGWRLVILDISDRIRLETKLMHAQKMESVGVLAGGVAHEFNNILSVILGNAEIASAMKPADEKVQKCLGEILTAGKQASNIVKELLLFCRKGASKRDMVDIVLLMQATVKLIRSLTPANIEIDLDIPAEPLWAYVNDSQIQQMLLNLCHNATDELIEQGGAIQIRAAGVEYGRDALWHNQSVPAGAYVSLRVSDTGKGMPPDVIERIFDPFYTTKAVGKGTGLGLSVVAGIVETNDGYIHVDSEVGKGTSFEILLPTSQKAEEVISTVVDDSLLRGDEHILIVDDEPLVVNVQKRMLEEIGYCIHEFTDPVAAIDAFRKDPEKFDLVLTDVVMPKMSGDKFSQRIMEIRQDVPVILCTGHSERVTKEQALSIGVQGYIMKPFERMEIAALIRKLLDETKGAKAVRQD